MHVCFKFCRRGAADDRRFPVQVDGQSWSLHVARSEAAGPWYPEMVEHSDEGAYRFFAGRLVRRRAGEPLPSTFTAVQDSAAEWRFEGGEPDGSWIALKFDRRRDEVSVACDMWVHQRWFHAHHDGAWFFSNSLVFLRRQAGRDIAIERRAIPYMLVLAYLPGRFTPLRGVSLLRPGEVIRVADGQMQSTRRARIPATRLVTGQRADEISPEVWRRSAEEILQRMQQAVKDELIGINEIVLPLSGGMDSRFLLGCAMDVLPRENIVTYTFGDRRTLDSRIASGLAGKLGIAHVPIGMDRRPVDEVCADGFEQTEGLALVFPNCPLGPDRKALLKPGTWVLSGYLGDGVFGSRDLQDYDPAHDTGDMLFRHVFERTAAETFHEALPLLASDRWDTLGYESEVLATPGQSLVEKYERWASEYHRINRVQHHLFVFPNRAFYLTPFTQRSVYNYSLSLPEAVRQGQRGYFMAMEAGYPLLHAYPTRRNQGLSLKVKSRFLAQTLKTWRRAMNGLDDAAWRVAGRGVYFDPYQLYGHRRELQQRIYHAAVAQCVDDLKQSPAFNRKSLDALHTRYRKGLPVSTRILRALFTVREWERQYA